MLGKEATLLLLAIGILQNCCATVIVEKSSNSKRLSRSIWPFFRSSTDAPSTSPIKPGANLFVGDGTNVLDRTRVEKNPTWKIHKYHGINVRPVEFSPSKNADSSTIHSQMEGMQNAERTQNLGETADEGSRPIDEDHLAPKDLSFLDDLGGLAYFLPEPQYKYHEEYSPFSHNSHHHHHPIHPKPIPTNPPFFPPETEKPTTEAPGFFESIVEKFKSHKSAKSSLFSSIFGFNRNEEAQPTVEPRIPAQNLSVYSPKPNRPHSTAKVPAETEVESGFQPSFGPPAVPEQHEIPVLKPGNEEKREDVKIQSPVSLTTQNPENIRLPQKEENFHDSNMKTSENFTNTFSFPQEPNIVFVDPDLPVHEPADFHSVVVMTQSSEDKDLHETANSENVNMKVNSTNHDSDASTTEVSSISEVSEDQVESSTSREERNEDSEYEFSSTLQPDPENLEDSTDKPEDSTVRLENSVSDENITDGPKEMYSSEILENKKEEEALPLGKIKENFPITFVPEIFIVNIGGVDYQVTRLENSHHAKSKTSHEGNKKNDHDVITETSPIDGLQGLEKTTDEEDENSALKVEGASGLIGTNVKSASDIERDNEMKDELTGEKREEQTLSINDENKGVKIVEEKNNETKKDADNHPLAKDDNEESKEDKSTEATELSNDNLPNAMSSSDYITDIREDGNDLISPHRENPNEDSKNGSLGIVNDAKESNAKPNNLEAKQKLSTEITNQETNQKTNGKTTRNERTNFNDDLPIKSEILKFAQKTQMETKNLQEFPTPITKFSVPIETNPYEINIDKTFKNHEESFENDNENLDNVRKTNIVNDLVLAAVKEVNTKIRDDGVIPVSHRSSEGEENSSLRSPPNLATGEKLTNVESELREKDVKVENNVESPDASSSSSQETSLKGTNGEDLKIEKGKGKEENLGKLSKSVVKLSQAVPVSSDIYEMGPKGNRDYRFLYHPNFSRLISGLSMGNSGNGYTGSRPDHYIKSSNWLTEKSPEVPVDSSAGKVDESQQHGAVEDKKASAVRGESSHEAEVNRVIARKASRDNLQREIYRGYSRVRQWRPNNPKIERSNTDRD
ncbi:synaptonemal complex protein 1-like [Prorops nasuta]|uniref:synaptonemal complex protein 1-like n=1 Tax=Prorops nasuta TaxID=863751 RepID=UPI0034CD9D57